MSAASGASVRISTGRHVGQVVAEPLRKSLTGPNMTRWYIQSR